MIFGAGQPATVGRQAKGPPGTNDVTDPVHHGAFHAVRALPRTSHPSAVPSSAFVICIYLAYLHSSWVTPSKDLRLLHSSLTILRFTFHTDL